MAFQMRGSQIGDLLSGGGSSSDFGAVPQPTQKVTNLSPHVDGGEGSSSSANVNAPADARATLHLAAGIVILALVLLWLMGGVLFRSASL